MLGLQWFDAALGGMLGLLLGSFLNVVVYRLPKMMERQWAAECAQLNGAEPAGTPPFNLNTPRSHCQQCKHQIRWFENIPIASYLFLRGKCSSCSTPISLRYPLVELATVAEAGYPGFEVPSWFGLVAPAGTPREIVQRLNAEVNAIQQQPAVRERLAAQGLQPWPGAPEQFAQRIKADYAKYGKVVRQANITFD